HRRRWPGHPLFCRPPSSTAPSIWTTICATPSSSSSGRWGTTELFICNGLIEMSVKEDVILAQLGRTLDGTHFEGLGQRYEGKVRDNYTTADGRRIPGFGARRARPPPRSG